MFNQITFIRVMGEEVVLSTKKVTVTHQEILDAIGFPIDAGMYKGSARYVKFVAC